MLDNEDNYSRNIEKIPEQTCVTLKFCGSHKDAHKYYNEIETYIKQNNLEISDFAREISLIDYGITNDTSKFVTEIQIPVKQL